MRHSLIGLSALGLASWLSACGGAPAASPAAPKSATAAPAPAVAPATPAAAPAAPGAAWSEATFETQLQATIPRRFPAATVTRLEADSYRIALPPPASTLDVNFF